MDPHIWIVVKALLLILLPLIPAVLVFKVFPHSGAGGNGTFAKIKWKFSGAFAGYVFLAMFLFVFFEQQVLEYKTDVWKIRGKIVMDPAVTDTVRLDLKTVPDNLFVSDNGEFELKIPLVTRNEELELPALIANLNRDGYPTKNIPLRMDSPGGGSVPKIGIDGKKKIVDIIDPIVIKQR
jgi:hypothetical protein